jgi:membrane protein YdbS with pleckstrin-like domain
LWRKGDKFRATCEPGFRRHLGTTRNKVVELRRRTWSAAIQLAVVISITAVLLAVAVSALGDVPQAAVVVPVILFAFAASWIRTGQVRRDFQRPAPLTRTTAAPTV